MNQKASMKNAGANNTWETVMRVVYPVKDAEQTLPLYALDWTRPHVAETTLDSRIDMRRLEFGSMNQSTLQRLLRNAGSSAGVSCDSFEIAGAYLYNLEKSWSHVWMRILQCIPRCILAPLDQCKNGAIRSDSSGKLQNQRIPFHGSWTDLSGFDEDDNGFGV